jgi:hypothetical protein
MVRTGTKYGPEYVERLAAGVNRHLRLTGCRLLTDQPERFTGVHRVDVSDYGLGGWWAKMLLFRPDIRGPGPSLYLDLDTIALGDLSPLEAITHRFSVCGSFAREFGNPNWPCCYGSCVMTFGDGHWGGEIWDQFCRNRRWLMGLPHGDQQAIEALLPGVDRLQELLPSGFFMNYRELPAHPAGPRPDASLLIFGGANKPHTARERWVLDAWRGKNRSRPDIGRTGSGVR